MQHGFPVSPSAALRLKSEAPQKKNAETNKAAIHAPTAISGQGWQSISPKPQHQAPPDWPRYQYGSTATQTAYSNRPPAFPKQPEIDEIRSQCERPNQAHGHYHHSGSAPARQHHRCGRPFHGLTGIDQKTLPGPQDQVHLTKRKKQRNRCGIFGGKLFDSSRHSCGSGFRHIILSVRDHCGIEYIALQWPRVPLLAWYAT